MLSEARRSRSRDRSESFASASSLSSRGGTGTDIGTGTEPADRSIGPVTGTGSYELHVLPGPEKARSIAAHPPNPHISHIQTHSHPHPDDGETAEPSNPDLILSSTETDKNMSRAPLLVRSSPAQGTGSYGGLPILSLSSSPADSDLDDNHVTNRSQAQSRGKKKGKGKSKLRHSEPASYSAVSTNPAF